MNTWVLHSFCRFESIFPLDGTCLRGGSQPCQKLRAGRWQKMRFFSGIQKGLSISISWFDADVFIAHGCIWICSLVMLDYRVAFCVVRKTALKNMFYSFSSFSIYFPQYVWGHEDWCRLVCIIDSDLHLQEIQTSRISTQNNQNTWNLSTQNIWTIWNFEAPKPSEAGLALAQHLTLSVPRPRHHAGLTWGRFHCPHHAATWIFIGWNCHFLR